MSPLYQLHNISKTYATSEAGRPAVDIERLDIPAGRVVAILGESGSGKTTLLNLLGMLDNPDRKFHRPDADEPKIIFNKDNSEQEAFLDIIRDRKQLNKTRRSTFGFVFQEDFLLKNISCNANIKIPLLINGLRAAKSPIDSCLNHMGLDAADFGPRLPVELSGGQAQRIAIIRSIIHDPRVIIADEPTSRLDQEHSNQIMRLLTDWCHTADDRTMIWVTHDIDLAARYSDHIIILRDGRVIASRPNDHHDPEVLLRWTRESTPLIEEEQGQTGTGETAAIQVTAATRTARYRRTGMPFFRTVLSILYFALQDIFPPLRTKTGRSRNPLTLPFRLIGTIFGVRKTQGLNILSLFMILLLAFFFSTISIWLKNYFVWSVSDPRINSVTITGRSGGDDVLTLEDMKKLSTLTWVNNAADNSEMISWQDEMEKKNLTAVRPAIIGAYGSRDRARDFLFNDQSPQAGGWNDLVMLDMVALNSSDPILKQISLLRGSSIDTLAATDNNIGSLFVKPDNTADLNRSGIVMTRTALKQDLGYTGAVPSVVKMDLHAELIDVDLLGVTEWLPFGARSMVTEGWYEREFIDLGAGDPLPGYDRITIYIRDMLKDGLPLARTLTEMGYRTKDDIQSRLAWIKNLTDFIGWSALLGVAGIALLVSGTLLVSYSQAIRKKKQEIGLLLAQGIPSMLLYIIFLCEICIVWAIAVGLAMPVHVTGAAFIRELMAEKFSLHMSAEQIFHFPPVLYWSILCGSLLLAWGSIIIAVRRIIGGTIADILKTAD